MASGVLLGLLPINLPAAQATNSDITVSHVPATLETAGDAITLTANFTFTCGASENCSNRIERLVWINAHGQPQSIERAFNPGTSLTASDTWQVTLPGDAVRYPTVSYHFEASLHAHGTFGGYDYDQAARHPTTGEHSASVKPLFRFKLTNPNGSAAANVPLQYFIEGSTADATAATTDLNGNVLIDPPMTDPVIVATQTTTGYAFIDVLAFTNFPTGPVVGTENRSGLGTRLILQINTGNDYLEAAQSSVQDKTFALQSMTIPFTSHTGRTSQVVSNSHTYESIGYDAAVNIGGHTDFNTEWNYKSSASTVSTTLFAVQPAVWSETGSKVTSKEFSEWGTGTSHGYDNPNCSDPTFVWAFPCHNSRIQLVWDFGEFTSTGCIYGAYGTCWYSSQIVPERLVADIDENTPHHHGSTNPATDCLFRLGIAKIWTNHARSESTAVSAGITGQSLPIPVHMSLLFQRETTQENSTSYTWNIDMSRDVLAGGPRYHYLFVTNGKASSTCPLEMPQKAYTASTTTNLGI
jgi:hypothetical protein